MAVTDVKVDMTGVVKVSSYLHIRANPSTSNGQIIGKLYNGNVVFITRKYGDWYYATNNANNVKGWSHSNYIQITKNNTTTTNANISTQSKQEQEAKAKAAEEKKQKEAEQKAQDELNKQIAAIGDYLNSQAISLSDEQLANSLVVQNLNGIYGIPYQFMPSVDRRLKNDSNSIGRKYAERIISKMPLLCITPGKCDFMSNYNKEEKKGILNALGDLITNDVQTEVDDIISMKGKYFTFAFDYSEYFEYVNGLCQSGAIFLEIGDVELDINGIRKKAKDFQWQNALNSSFKSTLTSQEFIGFYMDAAHSVSESFSNDTTQSQLSSTVNGVSDMAREASFLLGAAAGQTVQNMADNTMDAVNDIANKYFSGNKLFNDIASGFTTVASGGKLLFPEIWADSNFSKSFDIGIKLRTPDADTMSWYLNIYVPLCHLVALVAGHQADNGHGYFSPFLVRAFHKGLFNIDMGIIKDMSITKGKEAAWNINGLPTEIDVSLTITDLYGMLSIVKGTTAKNFVTNSVLMDYIANTCGININQIDVERTLEIYYILVKASVINLPNNINRRLQDAIDTFGKNLYDWTLNKFLI